MSKGTFIIFSFLISYGAARIPGQSRDECATCTEALGKIFDQILTPDVHKILVAEIQKDLNCTLETNVVFCSSDGADIILHLGKDIGFSHEEAATICADMSGACQRPWTRASCIDDTNAILYPRLTNEENKKRIVKKMQDEYSVLKEQLVADGEDEDHWTKDIDQLVGTFTLIFNDLGAGLLCSLVGEVLN